MGKYNFQIKEITKIKNYTSFIWDQKLKVIFNNKTSVIKAIKDVQHLRQNWN